MKLEARRRSKNLQDQSRKSDRVISNLEINRQSAFRDLGPSRKSRENEKALGQDYLSGMEKSARKQKAKARTRMK